MRANGGCRVFAVFWRRHKSYRTSIRIVPQGDRAAAKITITTEKRDAHIPDPHDYLQFVADVAKDMDEHLVGQAN